MADSDYQPVRDALPPTLPPITREEAERATKRLYRKFGKLDNGRKLRPPKVRRCWISREPTRGHWKGWGRLIHDVSHLIFRARYPQKRPHDKLHSFYEAEIARYVESTDWIQGGLKPKPKPKPTAEQKREDKRRRYADALTRWRTKAKRADTAIRKYERALKRLAA